MNRCFPQTHSCLVTPIIVFAATLQPSMFRERALTMEWTEASPGRYMGQIGRSLPGQDGS